MKTDFFLTCKINIFSDLSHYSVTFGNPVSSNEFKPTSLLATYNT